MGTKSGPIVPCSFEEVTLPINFSLRQCVLKIESDWLYFHYQKPLFEKAFCHIITSFG